MRFTILVALLSAVVWAADEPGWKKLEQPDLSDAQIQDIINKFAAKEAEFARARENYTYRQMARVQEMNPGNSGRWEMVTDVIFSPEGKRTERVVYAPVNTLQNIQLTPEDEQDLRNIQPFVLTTPELPKYSVRYLGKQMADEIPCYVFAVKPKHMEKGQRYFEGEVWVDDRDLQIVKSYGRGVGVVRGDPSLPCPQCARATCGSRVRASNAMAVSCPAARGFAASGSQMHTVPSPPAETANAGLPELYSAKTAKNPRG